MEETPRDPSPPPADSHGRGSFKLFLNVIIALMCVVVAYLAYPFFSSGGTPPEHVAPAAAPARRVIQLDVLNGCGARGAASKVTNFLRAKGFDVVEMKNYKSSHITQTMVVDRIGDLALARQVAAALGVPEKRVIQQLNPDYFVDVSVIIGGDYSGLQSFHER